MKPGAGNSLSCEFMSATRVAPPLGAGSLQLESFLRVHGAPVHRMSIVWNIGSAGMDICILLERSGFIKYPAPAPAVVPVVSP